MFWRLNVPFIFSWYSSSALEQGVCLLAVITASRISADILRSPRWGLEENTYLRREMSTCGWEYTAFKGHKAQRWQANQDMIRCENDQVRWMGRLGDAGKQVITPRGYWTNMSDNIWVWRKTKQKLGHVFLIKKKSNVLCFNLSDFTVCSGQVCALQLFGCFLSFRVIIVFTKLKLELIKHFH